MNEEIVKYIKSCAEYQRKKLALHKSYSLLQSLELTFSPWSSIAMDLIMDRPLGDGCDQLWVIIDCFTKMKHFIPLTKTPTKLQNLAVVFVLEIWRLLGLPIDIVSDYNS
jgi:hypothetical protein